MLVVDRLDSSIAILSIFLPSKLQFNILFSLGGFAYISYKFSIFHIFNLLSDPHVAIIDERVSTTRFCIFSWYESIVLI